MRPGARLIKGERQDPAAGCVHRSEGEGEGGLFNPKTVRGSGQRNPETHPVTPPPCLNSGRKTTKKFTFLCGAGGQNTGRCFSIKHFI